ncbi:MAG: hypothetical protein H6818_12815 [Phycisphaerales bacterium]|nr:hypothetical protein [Phycisphaerales bacterium]
MTLRHATSGIGLAVGLVISISSYILAWTTSNALASVGQLLIFVAPAGYMLRRHYRVIANAGRAAELGWRYALSAGIVVYLIVAFNVIVITGAHVAAALLVLLVGTLALAVGVVIATAAFVITWRLVQLTLPKFVVQDGTLCPTCAYCLVGVQSMRCPECGSAFSFADLETTEYEFQSRSEIQATHATSTNDARAK